MPWARAETAVPETLLGYARQQLRWNRSFYRELPWMLPLLRRRPDYLTLDVAARLLLPLLLPAACAVTALAALTQPSRLPLDGGMVAGMAFVHLLVGALHTRQPRFYLLYGLLHLVVLIPVRLVALLTLRDNRWGTRGAAARPAQLKLQVDVDVDLDLEFEFEFDQAAAETATQTARSSGQ